MWRTRTQRAATLAVDLACAEHTGICALRVRLLKRTAIATQKEVRKRALRAQRLSSNPENQLRCKKLARDVTNLAAQLEAAQDDRLVAAEKAAFLRRRQLGISSASGAADATSRRQLGLPSASGATYRSSAVSAVGAAGGSTSGSAPPRKRSRTADDAEGRAGSDAEGE